MPTLIHHWGTSNLIAKMVPSTNRPPAFQHTRIPSAGTVVVKGEAVLPGVNRPSELSSTNENTPRRDVLELGMPAPRPLNPSRQIRICGHIYEGTRSTDPHSDLKRGDPRQEHPLGVWPRFCEFCTARTTVLARKSSLPTAPLTFTTTLVPPPPDGTRAATDIDLEVESMSANAEPDPPHLILNTHSETLRNVSTEITHHPSIGDLICIAFTTLSRARKAIFSAAVAAASELVVIPSANP